MGSDWETKIVKEIFGNLTKGLPSLIGVLWGIYLYKPGFSWAFQILLVLALSMVCLKVGQSLLGKNPVAGWVFIELWVFSAIALVAASTLGILWLTVNAPSFLSVDKSQQDAVAGALVGAVTAFLAILWTKDIEDASGPFWPSTQFKKGLASAFGTESLSPPQDSRARDVVYEERVRAKGPKGWGFTARRERAYILQEFLKKRDKK